MHLPVTEFEFGEFFFIFLFFGVLYCTKIESVATWSGIFFSISFALSGIFLHRDTPVSNELLGIAAGVWDMLYCYMEALCEPKVSGMVFTEVGIASYERDEQRWM